MNRRLCVLGVCIVVAGLLPLACSEDESDKTTGTVIGSTSVEIDTRTITTHTGEAAIANFLTAIFRDEVEALGNAVDVVFINAGGIRGGPINPETFEFLTDESRIGKLFPKGDLTDQDVSGWLPFRNDTTIAKITGTQLKSILERSVENLPPDLRNDKGGWLLHADGLKYTADCSKTTQKLTTDGKAIERAGERIVKIELGSSVIYDPSAAIDTLASVSIKVATFAFLVGGFDGHLAFTEVAEADKTTIPIATLDLVEKVKDHVKAHSPIAPAKDGRLTIVGTCGVPGTTP